MDFTSVLMILVKQEGARAAIGELGALDAAGKRADGTLAGLSRRAGGMGKALGGVGRGLTHGITMPIVGIGVAAGDMAAKFQQAMELVHTQSGASQREVDKLKGKVLDLASVSKQGPVQLADALYRLEGAGLRGEKAMSALKAASQLAAVGNANVEDTAKTLSQAWFSGIKGAKNFKGVVAELNATVGAGDLRLQQLVDALGQGILPVAKHMGLSFHDITGVLATFGDETNNVSGWTAQLATALHYLTIPTPLAARALEAMGLKQTQLAEDLHKPHGLLTALSDLRTHLKEAGKHSGKALDVGTAMEPRVLPASTSAVRQTQLLGEVLPGGKGRVLSVLLSQLDRYKQKLQQVSGTTNKFGDAVSKTQQTAAFKIGNALAKTQVALVKFGTALLPVVVPMIQKVAKFIGDLGDKFSGLSPHVQKLIVIVGILAAALGPFLVALGMMATGLAVLLSPAALVVVALAALAAGLVYAYTHSERFRQIVTQVAATIRADFPIAVAWVKQAATDVANFAIGVGSAVKIGFEAAVHWVTGAVHTVVNEVRQWDTLGSVVKRVFGLILAVARLLFDGLKTIFLAGRAVLTPIFVGMWAVIKDVVSGAWTALKAIVSGGFQVLRGVVLIIGGLFKGDFRQMWQGIKTIFSGAFQTLKGLLAGAWQILKAPVDGIAAGLHDAFANTWGRIKGVFKSGVDTVIDFLNVLIKAINFIPGIPDIKPIGHIGGGGGGQQGNPAFGGRAAPAKLARGGAFARTGGIVNRPMTFMGEEAPRHKEFVIPTNPAYRGRARGLVAQAALAVGFAQGGAWGTQLSKGQLETDWTQAGGDPKMANLMAAIALAESGGWTRRPNAQGSGAFGPWQILGQIVPGDLGNPLVNAANAVAKLRTQGLGAWEAYTNGSYKQYLGGGGGGLVGQIAKGIAGSLLGGVGLGGLVNGLSAKDIIGKFPGTKGLGMFGGLGKYVIGKATAFVKDHVGAALGIGGGGGAASGPNGVGSFAGVPMANWVAQALQYAQRKLGYALHPTSGYRPGFDPHTVTGHSEHSGTQYPHGAVDFGGYHDAAALAIKLAVVNATRDFKWPLLAPAGFVDDGHASGTGHKKGGIWGGYASGTGGAQPGIKWVGEHGPELVRFNGGEQVYPHAMSMQMAARVGGYAKGTGKAKKAFQKSHAADVTAAANALAAAQNKVSPAHQQGLGAGKGFGGTAAHPTYNGFDIAFLLRQLGLPVGNALQNKISLLSYLRHGGETGIVPLKGQGTGGSGNADQALIDSNTALAAAQQALADALTGVQDELKRNTDFAESVKSTSSFQAEKTLTDVLSGHIVGRGRPGGVGAEGVRAPGHVHGAERRDPRTANRARRARLHVVPPPAGVHDPARLPALLGGGRGLRRLGYREHAPRHARDPQRAGRRQGARAACGYRYGVAGPPARRMGARRAEQLQPGDVAHGRLRRHGHDGVQRRAGGHHGRVRPERGGEQLDHPHTDRWRHDGTGRDRQPLACRRVPREGTCSGGVAGQPVSALVEGRRRSDESQRLGQPG
jgi:TP901 family phage tail tape measure protein